MEGEKQTGTARQSNRAVGADSSTKPKEVRNYRSTQQHHGE